MNDNFVTFKGNKDGLIIILDEAVDFPILKAAFTKKVVEAHKFFGNATTGIFFQGRDLTEFEETELLNIVATRSDLKVSRVEKIVGKKQEDEGQMLMPFIVENNSLFHRGSLRSGQDLRYAGSIVILGDVNPGGEVIAEGHVVVLGALKGMVHAGCGGDSDCFVSALNLMPTQLRIADIISYIPEEIDKKGKRKPPVPSYAYVEDGKIYIAPL